MDRGITENIYEINNIKMNVASVGSESDPPIVFLHGFPEVWQSWVNQMLYLSSKGYHCIAPDLRGYGKTEIQAPEDPDSYNVQNITDDIVDLMKVLNIDQIFLVGHDWGAFMAWSFCLFHPKKVRAVVNLSVPYIAMNPEKTFVQGFRDYFGDLSWKLLLPWKDAKVEVPAKFIAGEEDHPLHFEGMKDYIFINGGFKKDVPSLKEVVIIQDVPHFANQAKPDEISGHIYEFIKKYGSRLIYVFSGFFP
ncbi:hypothetical protein CsatB_013894 [Cannabis sativa]